MVSINNIAPLDVFRAAVKANEITERVHSVYPELSVFNYSSDTQYSQNWNAITLPSRGLIVNTVTGEIIARPFPKFFNFGDDKNIGELDYNGPIQVTDKADGALGILYPVPDGGYHVSTRGSMESIPALHATETYKAKYEGKWNPNPNHTYLMEIIYPGWPIVLNYGDMDDLIMLGAIDKETGASVPWDEIMSAGWFGPVVELFDFASFEEVVADSKLDHAGKEGFVVHFVDADKRVKLKFADYLRLHRIIFGVTPLRIWELLSNDVSVEHWVKDVPDEFADDVMRVSAEMEATVAGLIKDVNAEHARIVSLLDADYSRKDIAIMAKAEVNNDLFPDKAFGFTGIMALEAGRPDMLTKKAWSVIRPHGMDRM